MRKRVLEGSVLFISISKWIFLASVAGIIVGFSTAIFLKLLGISMDFARGYNYYFVLLPVAMFLSVIIVKYLAPEAEGHGTERVIEAVHKRSGKINPLVVPVKLLATIITITLGGSAGKEGPCAQIGAGLSSTMADLLRFDDRDRKKLVICGISAGFASVFGTPIAGAIFGVEVLFVGGLIYDVLLPSFVAGIVGYHVSSYLGITYFHHALNFVPVFSSFFFIKVCLGGLFFGLCSFVFIELLNYLKSTSRKIKLPMPYKGVLGGIVLAGLAFVVSTRYLGLGLDTIETALEGGQIPWSASFMKMLFTSITLNFGGSGGIVTPIFFIGATAGNIFGHALELDPAVFAAIGMVSLLAGAANTPISASIMAVEIFGPAVAPYAAVACVISFLMTGHRSVYPSQVLSMSKSSSITVEEGHEMSDMRGVNVSLRAKSITGGIVKGLEKIKKNKS
ncbi:MAG TPA: chloride channel protein [Candidatus Sulfobium mesophilum]|nr:chloride channel protein [Candidatus Sulfobium mesophilum]